jgi:hypothetical protein
MREKGYSFEYSFFCYFLAETFGCFGFYFISLSYCGIVLLEKKLQKIWEVQKFYEIVEGDSLTPSWKIGICCDIRKELEYANKKTIIFQGILWCQKIVQYLFICREKGTIVTTYTPLV